jgi:hypothetical protein
VAAEDHSNEPSKLDSDDDDVLVKKDWGQIHLQDLDAIVPMSAQAERKMARRAEKTASIDRRTLKDLHLEEDTTLGYYEQAQSELHERDETDKSHLRQRLHGERLKRKAAERAKEEVRHGDQRSGPGVTIAHPREEEEDHPIVTSEINVDHSESDDEPTVTQRRTKRRRFE